jgi:uncharacterized protein (DUF885 family)
VYNRFAYYQPAWATEQGIHAYDGRLFDPRPGNYEAFVREIDAFLERLAAIPATAADAIDHAALSYALGLKRIQLAEIANWRRDPDFVREVLDHVFPLLARPFAPLPARLASVTERLEEAPRYLSAARERVDLDAIPPLWVSLAVESTQSAPSLLEAVAKAADAAGLPSGFRERLDRAISHARKAFEEHLQWIERTVQPRAAGSWAIGEGRYDGLLAARGLPWTARTLVEHGKSLVAKQRAALREAAITLISSKGREPGTDPVAEAYAIVREDHPADFASVLEDYRASAEDARAFVRKTGIVSLPPGERLEILEMPAYLRHIVPFAAYLAPGRFDADQVGLYLVTPKVDLSNFARADIRNTTVHEAYPGHHLQLSASNQNPSRARALVEAVETIEGWALYCEEIMGRHGYTAAPSERFIRERDAHFRALRVEIDPSLHIGAMTFEMAVTTMREELGFSAEEAEAEVNHYTLDPAYAASYLLGKNALLDFRSEWEARGGSERGFHDTVVSAGSLPASLLEILLDATPVR